MAVSPVLITSRPARIQTQDANVAGARVRRRIDPQAGRALEILGHAIDYLTDEYIFHGGQFRAGDPELDALHVLMAANRTIYYECPVIPSLSQRFLRLFGIGRGEPSADHAAR